MPRTVRCSIHRSQRRRIETDSGQNLFFAATPGRAVSAKSFAHSGTHGADRIDRLASTMISTIAKKYDCQKNVVVENPMLITVIPL